MKTTLLQFFTILAFSYLFFIKGRHTLDTRPLTFPLHTSSNGDLDCSRAFAGKGKPTYGGTVHAGLVHPHGPCSSIKELSHLSKDMPTLALELLRKDKERIEKHLYKRSHTKDFISRSLATSNSTSTSEETTTGLSYGIGNYLMKVGVGTPKSEFLFILDTGSNLAWTQCIPCDSQNPCYEQASPLFDPTMSSSYAPMSCTSFICPECSTSGVCQYSMAYGDGSSTYGELAEETFTIGNATIQNYIFGCGHSNQGSFLGVDGILGLGWGAVGMPAQTISSFGGVFAYCLPSILSSTKTTGFIEFGMDPIFTNTSVGSSFTPMIQNFFMPSFYFVWLKGVSVGGVQLFLASTPTYPPSSFGFSGTFVDSGTVITRFPNADYATFRDAFLAGSTSIALLSYDYNFFFDTCFQYDNETRIPVVSFHFDGMDLPLEVENIIYPFDLANRIVCLAFAPISDSLVIIGNYQTPGRLITFDTVGSRMGILTSSKAC